MVMATLIFPGKMYEAVECDPYCDLYVHSLLSFFSRFKRELQNSN